MSAPDNRVPVSALYETDSDDIHIVSRNIAEMYAMMGYESPWSCEGDESETEKIEEEEKVVRPALTLPPAAGSAANPIPAGQWAGFSHLQPNSLTLAEFNARFPANLSAYGFLWAQMSLNPRPSAISLLPELRRHGLFPVLSEANVRQNTKDSAKVRTYFQVVQKAMGMRPNGEIFSVSAAKRAQVEKAKESRKAGTAKPRRGRAERSVEKEESGDK